jgi:hypothetical protein
LLLISFSTHPPLYAQQAIRGKVINIRNGKPLSNATLSISRKIFGLSDALGYFLVPVDRIKNTDTFSVSSAGFTTLKIPLAQAIKQSEFYVREDLKELENVEVKSYTTESSEGSVSTVTGYFRSWYTRGTGGEIGRILYVNSDDYKLERVRFKINNQCDTCIIRLHIRELRNGLPDRDLLRDSISLPVTKLTFDDKFSEFDLRNNNVIIKKNRYVFVSLETLNCTNKNNAACSLCFIGTEPGDYLYRQKEFADWEESGSHSIYLRLFYKY